MYQSFVLLQRRNNFSLARRDINKYKLSEGQLSTVTDPGFPRGGSANSPGGGRQHTILPKFPKKLHEIERIWTRGWGGGRVQNFTM